MKFMHKLKTSLNNYLEKHVFVEFFFQSFFLTLVIEFLSRKSLIKVARFMVKSPLTFFINMFIITLTFCVSLAFRSRRRFVQDLITLVWLILGIVNYVILTYRMTPFSAEDMKLLKMLNKIAKNYITPAGVAAIALAVAGVVLTIIILWKKSPKKPLSFGFVNGLMRTAVLGFGLYAVVNMGMQTHALSENFENLAEAYEDYGFAYCFSNSIVDIGISKPEDYSEESMQELSDQLRQYSKAANVSASESTGTTATTASLTSKEETVTPNIIMIQLESFFDPTYLKGYRFSEDPIPTFRALKENYNSGALEVPVVGAGTANTEFECLTGMSTDYFGAGEYPYNTVLQDSTDESLPNVLKKYGYTSTAVHNNTGTFYKRDKVFSQLGFNNFISEEFMYDMEETPNEWHKDAVLPEVMLSTMEQSEGADFIYTITVQSHGRYPSEQVLEDPRITVTCDEDYMSANLNAVTYYVNMVKEVDDMIADLIAQLEKRNEPTILVMYGDHLPALGFDLENLRQNSLYQTEYVMWDNMGLDVEHRMLTTETLGTVILDKLGLEGGILQAFHHTFDGKAEYDDKLKMLEYDMLYGNGYIYQENSDIIPLTMIDEKTARSYPATDLHFGYRTVKLNATHTNGDQFFVYGENFNESSRIVIDGKVYATRYIDSKTLQLDGTAPEEFGQIYIAQCDSDDVQLGEGSNVLTGSNVTAA